MAWSRVGSSRIAQSEIQGRDRHRTQAGARIGIHQGCGPTWGGMHELRALRSAVDICSSESEVRQVTSSLESVLGVHLDRLPVPRIRPSRRRSGRAWPVDSTWRRGFVRGSSLARPELDPCPFCSCASPGLAPILVKGPSQLGRRRIHCRQSWHNSAQTKQHVLNASTNLIKSCRLGLKSVDRGRFGPEVGRTREETRLVKQLLRLC